MIAENNQLYFSWRNHFDGGISCRLTRSYRELTSMQRVAVVLYREGHTDQEIAEFFNVKRKAINERRRRARQRLERMGLPAPERFKVNTRHVRCIDPSLFQ